VTFDPHCHRQQCEPLQCSACRAISSARQAASSKNEDVRQRSANVILDRAYGRPSQAISGDEDNPLELLMQHLDGCARGLPSEQQ
jgi:hypothetical protein